MNLVDTLKATKQGKVAWLGCCSIKYFECNDKIARYKINYSNNQPFLCTLKELFLYKMKD